MRRALASDSIALVESQLLGSLMVCPLLRLDCETLRPTDFSTDHRGVVFDAVMRLKHPEAGLVAAHLTDTGAPPPPRLSGWAEAICALLDTTFVEEDAIPDAVRAIKAAAIDRRAKARLNAA